MLSESEAIIKAGEYIEAYRAVSKEDYKITDTYNADGRWRLRFDVDGEQVTVRLDDETGNLAGEEGHSYTSENLIAD